MHRTARRTAHRLTLWLAALLAIMSVSACGDSGAVTTLKGKINGLLGDNNLPGMSVRIDPEATLRMLNDIPVKGRAPKTGYSREEFGKAWTDDNTAAGGHNGCDTRDDILRRDLKNVKFKKGSKCVVVSGVLNDPYTGKIIEFTRGVKTSSAVQIDHVVALSNAWQTGAQQLSAAQRVNLANDPNNLWAVDGPANTQKSDGDAATWLPPNKGFRCAYVARQIAVKHTYGLWVTPPEKNAMVSLLKKCSA